MTHDPHLLFIVSCDNILVSKASPPEEGIGWKRLYCHTWWHMYLCVWVILKYSHGVRYVCIYRYIFTVCELTLFKYDDRKRLS